MDQLWDAIDTLSRESGGGVKPSETLGRQGIRGLALLLEDGRVALIHTSAAEREAPLHEGGGPGKAGDGGSSPAGVTPSVSAVGAANVLPPSVGYADISPRQGESALKEGALGGAAL